MHSTTADAWTASGIPPQTDRTPATTGLDDWPLQVQGVIAGYSADTAADSLRTRRRLAELGFLPGEPVRVVARGWLRRSPVAVRVGQSTFALRAHEAAQLRVVPVGDIA